jgi:phosphoglycolate phosphatase-like HAD superfamily hydrolase/ADP-ribose pyrophosphatase YjhB (NUDIX family)
MIILPGMALIKNIILDWSGTLVDDLQWVFEASNEIFKAYNKPIMTLDEFREKFFLPFTEFYKIYLPEATAVELEHYYHTTFKLSQTNITLLPHAKELLEYCRSQEMPLFLLSAIHHEHFKIQGEKLGVQHFFKQVYVDAIDKRKTILHLLAEHDLDPQETMFIGDMVHDIETAHHGGVVGCAVLTGYDSLAKLRKANPDLVFRNLDHLRNHLHRHRHEPELYPLAAVGALIFNSKNEMLMIKTRKWSHLWGIPGGKIRSGETIEEAVRREIKEETNLDLSRIEFAMIQDCINPPEFYKQAHFVLLDYIARSLPGEVILNEEAEEYQWCSMEKALKLSLNTPTRILINYVHTHPQLSLMSV